MRILDAATRGPLRVAILTFALLIVAMTAWNVASPPGSGPDEPPHVNRAASIARGQLVGDADPIGLYSHLLSRLAPLGIAYVHMVEARDTDAGEAGAPLAIHDLRRFWPGTLILAGGFIGPSADAAIRAGQGDAVAFGRHFIANPDLPRRLQLGAALNPYNRATFAGGGAAGYTDYPTLQSAEAAE